MVKNMEPLFDTSSKTMGEKYTLFPISPKEQQLMKLYKKSVAVFWIPEEIDFSKDKEDWNKLSDPEKYFSCCSSILWFSKCNGRYSF